MSKWIGNECDFANKDNVLVHEYLCNELAKTGFSESDVVTASVGIWGAIHIMRMRLNIAELELKMRESMISDLSDEVKRLREIIETTASK